MPVILLTKAYVLHSLNSNIDDIFEEINAYILQFTTKSDTPTKCEKRWIFGAAFMVMSCLVTAYRIYKS